MISIIIPFKNKSSMLIECIKSIYKYIDVNYELILINDHSDKEELIIINKEINNKTYVVDFNPPFNFQKINNYGNKIAKREVLLFLNNDTEFVEKSEGLIQQMYQEAIKPDIGAVGCLMLYEDRKTIQHAGVILDSTYNAIHIFHHQNFHELTSKNHFENTFVTAVTGACLMIEKKKFELIGGFNENFIINGGDVDICLRLIEKGYKNKIILDKYIIHKESQTAKTLKIIPYQDFLESYKSFSRHFNLIYNDTYFDRNLNEFKQ